MSAATPAQPDSVAELLIDGKTATLDLEPLNLRRFKTGQLLHEPLTAHAGAIAG